MTINLNVLFATCLSNLFLSTVLLCLWVILGYEDKINGSLLLVSILLVINIISSSLTLIFLFVPKLLQYTKTFLSCSSLLSLPSFISTSSIIKRSYSFPKLETDLIIAVILAIFVIITTILILILEFIYLCSIKPEEAREVMVKISQSIEPPRSKISEIEIGGIFDSGGSDKKDIIPLITEVPTNIIMHDQANGNTTKSVKLHTMLNPTSFSPRIKNSTTSEIYFEAVESKVFEENALKLGFNLGVMGNSVGLQYEVNKKFHENKDLGALIIRNTIVPGDTVRIADVLKSYYVMIYKYELVNNKLSLDYKLGSAVVSPKKVLEVINLTKI